MNDELSREVRTLLDAARTAFTPGEARVAAVRAAIDARIATPSAPGSGGSLPAGAATVAASATTPHLVAWGLVGGVLLAGGAALVAWHLHGPAPSSSSLAVQATAVPAAASPLAGSPAGDARQAAPSPAATNSDALPIVNAEALPVVAASSAQAPRSALRARPPRKETAPAAAPAENTPPPALAVQAASPPAPSDDSLAREIPLLRAARAALDSGDAERALALLARHAQLWPAGVLAEERLATQVLALCALGRTAEARAAAGELESLAPESPHLARVRASCARRPRTDGP